MAKVYVSARTAIHPGGDAVAGVYVALYDDTSTFVTSAASDANGVAFLGERPEATYEIRISAPAPSKVQKGTMQSITVVGATDQAFDVVIDTTTLQESPQADVCRCSGIFIDSFGQPVKDLSLHFSEELVPSLLHLSASNTTKAVVPRQLVTKTDSDGFASVDLIQDSVYSVYMEGFENIARSVKAPKLTVSSLPDVLFPVIDRVEYEFNNAVLMPVSGPTVVMTVSTEKTLSHFTVFRSGLKVSGLSDVEFDLTDTDTSIVSVSLTGDEILLEALAVGITSIGVKRIVSVTGTGITIYPDTEARGTLYVNVQEIPA